VLTLLAILLALLVVPHPWGWVLVAGAAAVDVLESVALLRWSRRRRATVGVETLVGRTGAVVSTLAPAGQVRVGGELWAARTSAGPLPPGARVGVAAVDGLVLVVEPVDVAGDVR
jgi:membrane protein implicated in regulation of membrane protease activity